MDPLDAIHAQMSVPKTTKTEIASFLSQYVGEERTLAARMLTEGAVSNTYATMLEKAGELHTKVQGQLEAIGLSTEDLRLVSDKDPGGSTHMISYLYGRANGLSPENFISARGSRRLAQSGAASKLAIA